MSFRQAIVARLRADASRPVVDGVTGEDLLGMAGAAQARLRAAGVRPGDRCVAVAANSPRSVALDLALLCTGAVGVPLYWRQDAAGLADTTRDAEPALVVGDVDLGAPRLAFDDLFAGPRAPLDVVPLEDGDLVRIFYTSGTSGRAKGAMISRANVAFMLERTGARLDALARGISEERVFHYLPFCFAGSWILLLTVLARPKSRLFLCTHVDRLRDELRAARPHYLLNVPLMLERIRSAAPRVWRPLLRWGMRRAFGGSVRALICGSAPLDPDTQRFFEDAGLPVLQVYGLTETTAICTMDEPGRAAPGFVGPAIDGIEMRLDDDGEIVVRGPNVFAGYWRRPEETAETLREGWLRTGDLGERDAQGRWRVLGRRKELIVLASGHNVAPEPLEARLRAALPEAAQVVVLGHGARHLTALVAGKVPRSRAEEALARLNPGLPHYQRLHGLVLHPAPLTPESGCLTANGKLRRAEIARRFAQG